MTTDILIFVRLLTLTAEDKIKFYISSLQHVIGLFKTGENYLTFRSAVYQSINFICWKILKEFKD